MDIFKGLRELNLICGEFVVIGGCMAAHGIRDAHDLDILVTPILYKKLLDEGYDQCHCKQCMQTSRLMLKKGDVDILPNLMFGNYVGDTTRLIRDADIINGFPFINLTEFIKFKRELGRRKDLKDVKLIEEYLKLR